MIVSSSRRLALCATVAVLVSSCASAGSKPASTALDADPLRSGAARLAAGDARGALPALTNAVADNPLDPAGQTLLGLAYQLGGADRPDGQDLALAGYDLALRQQPGQFWGAALAGRAAFDRGRYEEASDYFARAVLAAPSDGRALHALAASAYMAGDAELAAVAAERAGTMTGEPAAWRLAAFARAALGDQTNAMQLMTKAGGNEGDQRRMSGLIRTAAVDQGPTPEMIDPLPEAGEPAPDQISVDVAIVLAQNTQRDQVGVNLLDGLKLQYGYNSTETRNKGVSPSVQRVIVEAIGVPQLNYNLNIFNRSGQFYQVVARPTLTAYRGETSEFFIGRSLKVAVAGVNIAQLETVDVGIEMKVTPIAIDGDRTRIRIETGRSFLSQDVPGNFNEALATWRQKVAATAEVRFGETLVLSGLSESVDDSTFSRTPVLGDAPLVGSVFNQRAKVQRRDAVLILVTPSHATRLPGRPWARPPAVERLTALWTEVVDPASSGTDVAARLRRARLFRRMTPGDAPLAWPAPAAQTGEIVRSLLIPGS